VNSVPLIYRFNAGGSDNVSIIIIFDCEAARDI
jgi:hypothetical protein